VVETPLSPASSLTSAAASLDRDPRGRGEGSQARESGRRCRDWQRLTDLNRTSTRCGDAAHVDREGIRGGHAACFLRDTTVHTAGKRRRGEHELGSSRRSCSRPDARGTPKTTIRAPLEFRSTPSEGNLDRGLRAATFVECAASRQSLSLCRNRVRAPERALRMRHSSTDCRERPR
jgi:hypothetical protein